MYNLAPEKKIRYAKAEGYNFSLDENVWILNKDSKINFECIQKNLLPQNLMTGFRETLAYFAENNSANYVENLLLRIKAFLLFCDNKNQNNFTTDNLINYRHSIKKENAWYISLIRIFLRKWNHLGYEGISDDVVNLLEGWTLKGNIRGDSIKRKDPEQGPLTDHELSAFNEKVIQAYEKGSISKRDLVICLLLSHTGRRTIQISHLKIKDIISSVNKKGETVYFINIPRAKQRGNFREEFKLFALTEDVWKLCHSLAMDNHNELKRLIKIEYNDSVLSNAPLFPNWNVIKEFEDDLNYIFETDKSHIRKRDINYMVSNLPKKENIISERTGNILNLNPRRFRYTIGTRAAREGFGELIIAELLDHSDTQNAGVYVKNVPEHVAKIDEAVGFQLAPFAQAFVGKLVDKESDSVRGNDKSSRIRNDNGKPVGNCGDYGFCGANVPIPCYTCIHFQPWVDGPHKEVYENLLEERKRIEKFTGDIAITEILDRSIMAVAEVVQKCEKRKSDNIISKKALK
ncbi:site-specific integrase [Salmonella enterica]|nr:site-specific integrase [Salmonella enterica]